MEATFIPDTTQGRPKDKARLYKLSKPYWFSEHDSCDYVLVVCHHLQSQVYPAYRDGTVDTWMFDYVYTAPEGRVDRTFDETLEEFFKHIEEQDRINKETA